MSQLLHIPFLYISTEESDAAIHCQVIWEGSRLHPSVTRVRGLSRESEKLCFARRTFERSWARDGRNAVNAIRALGCMKRNETNACRRVSAVELCLHREY
jgi:hypothetical protein